jgi:D-tyrosyl-tRNA(Tyr) deacylase
MIGLLQRVSSAHVTVAGVVIARISAGLLVLVGIRPSDDEATATQLLARILKYRVFSDERGKMNRSLRDIDGDLLLVPQFTLAADTHHGLRPGFSTAAPPEHARPLFEHLAALARVEHAKVQSGQFGADMQVSLVNEGPVTLWLESG